MPVLSLPLPMALSPICFPIRIPFPMVRIGTILPYSLSVPLKEGLLALFRLAWSNKLQLPVLITVCFLALDIRLQLEINIFWEPPRHNNNRPRGEQRAAQRNVAHSNSVIAATLLHRQRQRLLLQERTRQLRREIEELATNNRRFNPATGLYETTETEDTDAVEASQESAHDPKNATEKAKRRRKLKKRLMKKDPENHREVDSEEESLDEEDDDEEEDSSFTDGDDEDDDDDDDGNHPDDEDGASLNGLLDEFSGDQDHFFDDNGGGGMSDNDDDSDSDGGTPLVVELEIRQRPSAVFFNTVTNKMSTIVKSGLDWGHLLRNEIIEAIPIINPTRFQY